MEATTADLYLMIFVWIDDMLKQNPVLLKRPGPDSTFSDSEALSVMVLQPLLGFESDRSYLRWLRKDYGGLFPGLPERTRYQRRRKVLARAAGWLVQRIQEALEAYPVRDYGVDSIPLAVCHPVRGNRCRIFQRQAAWGRCVSKKQWVYGFKLHILMTREGLPAVWALLPANRHDRKGLDVLLEDAKDIRAHGDSAYLVKSKDRKAFSERNAHIVAQPRKNMMPLSKTDAKRLKKFRARVEQTNSQLANQFNAEKTLARTLPNLAARVDMKMLSFNMGVALNVSLGRPPLALKSLAA